MDHYPPSTLPLENCPSGSDSMHRLVRHLDLFSGIGGFALAAQMVGGIETVGFCEIDPWPREILKKNFPNVPIHDDVKTLDPKHYGRIDLITGGYPCQPFSLAGQRKGAEDDRHLWPEVLRILKSAQPTWLLCENVYGHISMGIDQVLSDLEAADYAGWAFVIPACAVGAGHRRDRVWVVANRKGINGGSECNHEGGIKHLESAWEPRRGDLGERGEANHWSCEPGMGRVAHGIPPQVDRIKALGNAIVPQVAAEILRHMMRVHCLANDKIHPR